MFLFVVKKNVQLYSIVLQNNYFMLEFTRRYKFLYLVSYDTFQNSKRSYASLLSFTYPYTEALPPWVDSQVINTDTENICIMHHWSFDANFWMIFKNASFLSHIVSIENAFTDITDIRVKHSFSFHRQLKYLLQNS